MTRIMGKVVPFRRKKKAINHLIFTPGIWINGEIYWLKNKNERFFISEGISVKIHQRSTISKVNFFDIFVTNHHKNERQVKLLMMYHHPYQKKEHFSFISPVEKVIYYFSGGFMHLINGSYNGNGFNHYTVQPEWNITNNIFWDCHEKGTLKYQPMLRGSATSIYTFDLKIGGREVHKCSSWSILGTNNNEIQEINKRLTKTH